MVLDPSPGMRPHGPASPPDGLVARLRALPRRALQAPPDALRRGPFEPGAFTSRLHHEWVAARLGRWLGACFSICFVTGLISHYMQHPAGWMVFPSRPVNFYRFTQGLHVLTGLASIPLLLAKLWVVYPKLWEWPPARTLVHVLERTAVAVLVGAAVFQLFTGLANIAYWYPFRFYFTFAHYWTAWIAIGALLIHIGAKQGIARAALRKADPEGRADASGRPDDAERPEAGARPDTEAPVAPAEQPVGLSRRGFVTTVGITSGVVVAAFAGQTVPGLSRVDLLGARRPGTGVQGLPVNKSAAGAGVVGRARNPAYRLTVDGPRSFTLDLDELRAMTQHTVGLPITCVEGWSAHATWTGVSVRELLDRAGAPHTSRVRVESLQSGGLYRASTLDPPHARDELTLLALRVNGEDLALDHGFPCRLIAPNRPGVLQTKWVKSLSVLA